MRRWLVILVCDELRLGGASSSGSGSNGRLAGFTAQERYPLIAVAATHKKLHAGKRAFFTGEPRRAQIRSRWVCAFIAPRDWFN